MIQYILGDLVKLKKGHACGENVWKILRTGIDFKLECQGCSHIIWMKRVEFNKRVRKIKNKEGKFVSIVNFERELNDF